jgi:uncharacterized C2H2 Zn-finger protein
MTESITNALKCNQCGAVYDSEKELSEHQQAAHHAASRGREPHATSKEESGKPEDVNQPDKAKTKNA